MLKLLRSSLIAMCVVAMFAGIASARPVADGQVPKPPVVTPPEVVTPPHVGLQKTHTDSVTGTSATAAVAKVIVVNLPAGEDVNLTLEITSGPCLSQPALQLQVIPDHHDQDRLGQEAGRCFHKVIARSETGGRAEVKVVSQTPGVTTGYTITADQPIFQATAQAQ